MGRNISRKKESGLPIRKKRTLAPASPYSALPKNWERRADRSEIMRDFLKIFFKTWNSLKQETNIPVFMYAWKIKHSVRAGFL
jgi:hypothetical protein